jgi:putative ABC transport system permease protein
MNLVTRGIRNAFRNSIRAVSLMVILGLSIGLCLTMLLANKAVGAKIDSVKASVGNTVTISPAGARGFEGGGNPLTQAQVAKVSSLAHVTKTQETLSDRLTSSSTSLQSAVDAGSLGRRFSQNSGQSFGPPPDGGGRPDNASGATVSFTPPVTVNGATDPTTLSSGGGTFALTSGTVFKGDSTENVAVIGSSLATKNNLKVGSTFTAYGASVTVLGVFDAGNTFGNNQVLMPLKTVQTLSAQPDTVTGATLTVDSISNVAAVTTAASKTLGSAADVTNDSERAQTTVAPLQNIQSISLYSLIGSVVAGSVIILLTMIMIVRERRREIGVLKAIGASNLKVMGQFMVEALTLTVLAAGIGIILGVIAGNPITHLLVTNSSNASTAGPGGAVRGAGRAFGGGLRSNLSSIHASVGWDIIVYGLLAAVVIALVGSALASFFIAKIRPADVMRTE